MNYAKKMITCEKSIVYEGRILLLADPILKKIIKIKWLLTNTIQNNNLTKPIFIFDLTTIQKKI